MKVSFLKIFSIINLIFLIKSDEPEKNSDSDKELNEEYDPELYYEKDGIIHSSACRNITHPSKQGCSVAPRADKYRCCFVNWKDKGVIDEFTQTNGKCDYFIDTKTYLKNYKEANKDKYDGLKIQCSSNKLTESILINVLIILSILLLF